MPKTTLAWFHTLAGSVAALGAATLEYRMAHKAAQATAWQYEPLRLSSEEGETSVPGRHFVQPHNDAHLNLKAVYDAAEIRIKNLYENAALAYAYGTADAIVKVLNGECPRHVELARADGLYVQTPDRLPDLEEALGGWQGGPNLVALREIVAQHERARAVVREFAFYEDLADYECLEFTEASDFAAGLANAAFAYGQAAERALQFVLISAHAHHIAEESE